MTKKTINMNITGYYQGMKFYSRVIFMTAICTAVVFTGILCSCRKGEIPTLTTNDITNITTTSAVTGGDIISDGGAEIISRGVCWNTTGNPTIANQKTSDGSGSGSFKSNIMLLKPDTYYTIRAYATNSAGTGYGNEQSFVTRKITIGSVDDIDGNTYRTIDIGTQIWMAENLKTSTLNDGTSIPNISDMVAWNSLVSPGYCYYDNNASAYKADYGALYNWYTVATGKLCPTGWHVPTDNEWTIMINYLGGEYLAGDKLKEAGTAHWVMPNPGVSNLSGFTALPGGGRIDGVFGYIGRACAFWSSTFENAENAFIIEMDEDIIEIIRGSISKKQGFSIRCVKN